MMMSSEAAVRAETLRKEQQAHLARLWANEAATAKEIDEKIAYLRARRLAKEAAERELAEKRHTSAPAENCLKLAHDSLIKIAAGENPELDLRHLSAVLFNLREIAEGTGVPEMIDDLYRVAAAYDEARRSALRRPGERLYRLMLERAADMESIFVALQVAISSAPATQSAK
jgi:hypothetical protein